MQKAFIFMSLASILFLSACSNMAPADKASAIFPNAHEFGSTAIAFSPDGQYLVSGGHQGDVKLWGLRVQKPVADAKPHTGAVRAIAISSSARFATASDDGRIFMWDKGKQRIQDTDTLITSLVWFQGKLVSGHKDKSLRVWDNTLKELTKLQLDDDVVGLSVNGNKLAVAQNNQIILFDPAFKAIQTLDTGGTTPHDIQFSPDGKRLAAGGWFRLHIWELDSGEHKSIATEHGGLLTSVSFSPDSKHIVTLGRHSDSAIRIMGTKDFQVERRYQAHELCGAMIRFSPNGRWMASASDDESIRFYDLTREYQPGKIYESSFHSITEPGTP